MLEKKYIKKPNWKRVIKSKYVSCNIEDIGIASLTHIQKITSPLFKTYENIGKVKIIDEGYYLLQIALKNTNYWISAMYDKDMKLIQYYIDITYKNIISDGNNSYFYDLILDVVLINNTPILLDEDELEEAFRLNMINMDQVLLANNTANLILKDLEVKSAMLDDFCAKYLNLLLKDLKKS